MTSRRSRDSIEPGEQASVDGIAGPADAPPYARFTEIIGLKGIFVETPEAPAPARCGSSRSA